MHDPALIEDVRDWLCRARDDLEVARLLVEKERRHLGHAMYCCQQCAEKSFKAFLTLHDFQFKRTHSLKILCADCAQFDPTLDALSETAHKLTPYNWMFRYPGEDQNPSIDQARLALEIAISVMNEVVKLLPPETHPATDAD